MFMNIEVKHFSVLMLISLIAVIIGYSGKVPVLNEFMGLILDILRKALD